MSSANPCPVPSWSIDVSRISPAPRSTASRAHSIKSRPLDRVPPCDRTSHPVARALASIATMALCDPASLATAVISAGSEMAAVFIDTLSAPARSSASASATARTPPPTAKGMFSSRATCSTRRTSVPRASRDALMSRKHTSSAPAAP